MYIIQILVKCKVLGYTKKAISRKAEYNKKECATVHVGTHTTHHLHEWTLTCTANQLTKMCSIANTCEGQRIGRK